jgi:hypothetical protein
VLLLLLLLLLLLQLSALPSLSSSSFFRRHYLYKSPAVKEKRDEPNETNVKICH